MKNLSTIQNNIHENRGLKVMPACVPSPKALAAADRSGRLDFDLATLYQVETKALNQAAKRNSDRFPEDFMFKLTAKEWEAMRSQFVTASQKKRNVLATPFAFTEHGVTMPACGRQASQCIAQ